MRNAGLNKAQAGIKIAKRNINNLRFADDTTLMEENEEELNSLLMKVKEESEKEESETAKVCCLVLGVDEVLVTVYIVPSSICHEVMGPHAMIFVF